MAGVEVDIMILMVCKEKEEKGLGEERLKMKVKDPVVKKDFAALLDSMVDWAWEMDIDGVHTYSNRAVKDILGYEVEEVIGKSSWELWPDEDKEKIDEDDFKEILKEGKGWTSYPGRFQHKDGSIIYLESTAIPIYSEEDELEGYRGIDRDITERKKAEDKEALLDSLLRHDIKNKLQITKAYLQLMEDEEISDEARKLLWKAQSSVREEERLINKIEKLRMVNDSDDVNRVRLKRYVHRSIDNVDSITEEKDIKIKTDEFDDENVLGGELLEELFTNILENSLIHSDCSEIKISNHRDSNKVIVVLEDDGKGIPDDEKQKILMKRYKGRGSKGSGLGLYLVKKILELYHGDIDIEDSEELGGVKIKIYFNRAETDQ